MDEVRLLELFYHALCAEVRKGQAEYLKERKRVPLPLPLPEVDDFPPDDVWELMGVFGRLRFRMMHRRQVRARARAERNPPVPVDDVLLNGYNAGIEKALAVMATQYKVFTKRAKIEDGGGYGP